MGQRLRKRISNILLRVTVVSSICFGLLPFYYNKQQQRFVSSKPLLIYKTCINVTFFILMTFLLSLFIEFDDAFGAGDPLAELLNRLTIYISFGDVLITWWINWTSRQRLQQLFNEFASIEIDYLYRYKYFTDECATFDYYVFWKVFATLLQNLSFFYSTTVTNNHGWLFIIFMFLLALLTNIIFHVSTHFFLAVLFTYRFIWVLNRRLASMAGNEVSSSRLRVLSIEIDNIAYIYTRLIRLCAHYTRIHQYQLLLLFGSMTLCNIEVLFYVRLLWSGKVNELNAFNVFAILQIVVVNILDFWLTITICEQALVTSQKTVEILRGFNENPKYLIDVERSLEGFAIICSNTKLRFNLCGLFDINHSSGLNFLLTMILYLIYLIQYYHENL
ncbi:gustatory receptor for bitter taste 22e-like [Bactrocera dorsalis]|uniref:Gustatory receptor n=1 Tax=Bactrocera dorsalis TaxID=27457 RepID=A0A6I9VJC2_BACDO|nr:gustatory receptor for bitter taste 22e-like [Bactrocera dorsalis]